MGEKESTVRARELGMALARALREAGLSNRVVARKLGWSPSKVSNLLNAKRGAQEADVASILVLCGMGGAERERLLELTRQAHESGWWQEYGDKLPVDLQTLIDHEDAALAITAPHSSLVPGLLQVGDYTRALLRAATAIPDDSIEQRVAARLKRQEIFDRQRPATFTFFIDEYVLTRTGAGGAAMSEQVHHLL